MKGMKCEMCINTLTLTALFFSKLSLLQHFRQFIMAGVLTPFNSPSFFICQVPFRSQLFHQYFSLYFITCLSTTDTSSIMCQNSQTQLNSCDNEPSAESEIASVKASSAAVEVDSIRIFKCNNKKSAECGSSGTYNTLYHCSCNWSVIGYSIMISDSAHEISSDQKC